MKVRFTLDTGDHVTLRLDDRNWQVDKFGWLWVNGIGVNLARVVKMQRVVGSRLVDFPLKQK